MPEYPILIDHEDPNSVKTIARMILEADVETAAALAQAELLREDVSPTWEIDPDDEGVDDSELQLAGPEVAAAGANAILGHAERDIGGDKENPKKSNCTVHTRWWNGSCFQWCAAALSYWFHHAGASPLVAAEAPKGFIYTPSGAAWFKRNGLWGTTPRRGAVVFFRFSGDRIHHVGIVVGLNSDGSITTIEGNTSPGPAGSQRDGGGVYKRTRRSGIVGYGYPRYGDGNGDGAPPYPGPPPLRRGSSGPYVLRVQQKLRMDYSGGPGLFGPQTEAAVIQFQRKCRTARRWDRRTAYLERSLPEVSFRGAHRHCGAALWRKARVPSFARWTLHRPFSPAILG